MFQLEKMCKLNLVKQGGDLQNNHLNQFISHPAFTQVLDHYIVNNFEPMFH